MNDEHRIWIRKCAARYNAATETYDRALRLADRVAAEDEVVASGFAFSFACALTDEGWNLFRPDREIRGGAQ